ncbi:DNA-directed RNA polymerase I subunit RPA1 [Orchesella cincta]|uniref:DNA-directed RNA polymerase subunit n=1 Tax=Orchesella cincta TaxID=48709 RepID=A0A1D2M930_ORCCI|nr:DNA-directed RNA polymerase I subunit RPA1 [Orchesella cincta]
MGPYDPGGICTTCQQPYMYCPGHFGRIELPLPVVNPLFSNTLLKICRMSCLECHSVSVPGAVKYLTIAQMKLLKDGLLKEAQEAEFVVADLVLDGGPGGKAKKKLRSEDDEMAKIKFEEYLRDVYLEVNKDSRNFGDKSTTRNLESLKHSVIKRAYSFAKMSRKCGVCGATCKKLMLFESRIVYSMGGSKDAGDYPEETVEDLLDNSSTPRGSRFGKVGAGVQKYLTPMEAMNHLRQVWEKDADFLKSLFPVLNTTKATHPTDLFFVEVVGVPPPKNRAAQMVNNQMVEHPQNLALRHIVTSCTMLNYVSIGISRGTADLSQEAQRALKSINGKSLPEKLETIWNELQTDVDHLMDRDKSKMNISANAAASMIGLKQIIEKKEGLFRMHMMGKRVNYAARTVITPDPNIDTEEIGIPDVFAKTLTFPTPVTPWNVHLLKKMVMNGPDIHPGAVAIENELGQVTKLDANKPIQRQGLANRLLARDKVQSGTGGLKIVYRHLMNGDYLLLNRQPSLHRPSIMAHKARILYGDKVFRLHYANCKHYNADFDGDEMNAHFPQSHIGRSEAANLVNVCSHFLVPKDGTPLAGLIQDHIVAAVRLTVRGRFFSYRDYIQLVYFALSNYTKGIDTEPPAIVKPVKLWSGKQVISTVIRNLVPSGRAPLTLTYNSKIKADEWRQLPAYAWKAGGPIKGDELSESVVMFRHGHLICGVLDKQSLGATPFGLCHAFYELYGNQSAGALLSSFSRLMTNFLQWEGFTLGVKDVLVLDKADLFRRQFMEEASKVGHAAAAMGVSLPADASPEQVYEKLEQVHRSRDPKKRAFVDSCYKKALDQFNNQINRACLPHGLVDIFPDNNLQLLVQSGAKGSTVNTMQMSCALGQIELEGKRPHMTMSGKTLPSFKAYDVTPRAGGFIAGRFLTGIRPQEFFFHCMAGREGLIDTAVKTSRSGYLQRCLVKLLEGVVVQYDGTVRDSDGSVIQFMYGEDGLDVGKSQYLKPKQLKFLESNSNSIVEKDALKRVKDLGDKKKINHAKKKIVKWTAKYGSSTSKLRRTGFLQFCEDMSSSVEHATETNSLTGRTHKTEQLVNMWRQLTPEDRQEYDGANKTCPDPLLSYLRPDSNFSVISESLDNILRGMKKEGKLSKEFENVVHYKAMKSLSVPGDAVGVLAAQSVGEPSTQMTLNTFHFAGRGEMNVTLGIPRLREILMVASANIKTPSMDIPFHPDVSEKQAEKLRLQLTKVTVSQVLQQIEVREKIDIVTGCRVHILKFVFLDYSEYSKNFCVKPKHILAYIEGIFLKQKLIPALRKINKKKKQSDEIEVGKEGKGGLDDDEIDEGGGGGPANAEGCLQRTGKARTW